jgi:hypothetical protein
MSLWKHRGIAVGGLPYVTEPSRQAETVWVHAWSNHLSQSLCLRALHSKGPVAVIELLDELIIGSIGNTYRADNTVPLHDHAARSISLAA